MKIVIDSHYAPCIEQMVLLSRADEIVLETRSFYQKGSYRNRCHIYGANGLLRLSIPLRHGKNQRKRIGEVEISYDHPWQSLHWESLCAAYRSSPYFEFYEDDIQPLFEQKEKYLLDFNQHLLSVVTGLIGMEYKPTLTKAYEDSYPDHLDMRERIHPNSSKNDTGRITLEPYIQVFGQKHGYLSNLSVFDLLFNEGPASFDYLRNAGASGFFSE